MQEIEQMIIIAIIAGTIMTILIIYIQWLFIKSAVKHGVEEAIMNILQNLDLIEDKEQSSIDFIYEE